MKRRLHDNIDQEPRRRTKQRTITSMLDKGGPKYVEVTRVQLEFPYYNHKFRAPHGLVNHKYMRVGAGDTLYSLPKESDRCILAVMSGSALTFTDLVQESFGYS